MKTPPPTLNKRPPSLEEVDRLLIYADEWSTAEIVQSPAGALATMRELQRVIILAKNGSLSLRAER